MDAKTQNTLTSLGTRLARQVQALLAGAETIAYGNLAGRGKQNGSRTGSDPPSGLRTAFPSGTGKAFQIQTSTNGTTWTTIYSTTTGTGGNQNLTVAGSGRYVRVYGTQRGTSYGYSLYEFGVYGS